MVPFYLNRLLFVAKIATNLVAFRYFLEEDTRYWRGLMMPPVRRKTDRQKSSSHGAGVFPALIDESMCVFYAQP